MNLSHVEHLGIAVKSIEEALPFSKGALELTYYSIEKIVDQRARTVFLKIGEVKLEFPESTSDESPIARFIEKRGEGIHHLTLSSDDVAPALEELRGKGIHLIDKKSRKGTEGLDTAFVHPKNTHGILLGVYDCRDAAK